MPRKENIKKVLVIGSGPIIIGQAAEFDYAGTQACRSLKEEGLEVVLINSNPATIMTDSNIADHVYIEPLNVETVKRIILKEKPDSVLPALGGQTGLNLAMELAEEGFFSKHNIELLGTNVDSIKKAEDRQAFKDTMESINQPCIASKVVNTLEDALDFAAEIGLPVIVRPAYTLGGTGGGIAYTEEELREITINGLRLSRVTQVLIEKCISGWKEIEFEVLRDAKDNAITICSMENIDPVGVHTGDSMVVAPCQTLTTKEFSMLKNASIKIIRALGIKGGCNVQFALDPESYDYYVIEVNPRVSRSSALASKASGFPIARVTAKIACGLNLEEIEIASGQAAFEPTLDYVVCKFARFPFDKFNDVTKTLSTQMKATGEVMSLGRTFEEAFLKGIRSLETKVDHVYMEKFDNAETSELLKQIEIPTDERIFMIAELLRRDVTCEEINEITKIDLFFLRKIENIILFEKELKEDCSLEKFIKAKKLGFSDQYLAKVMNISELDVYKYRKENNIYPVYKMIDTCAAELDTYTPYFYSTYDTENESIVSNKEKIIVLGSGPIRIGQGVEFDYSTVHAIWAIKEKGYEAIVINNNPETVSTDYLVTDKLYFEPLTVEDIMNIIDLEKPKGVIVSLGGQTAINLAERLDALGVPIIGTDCEAIAKAENRKLFEALMHELNIPEPEGKTVFNLSDGLDAAHKITYPVLVRPSYVLGGRAMEIVYSDEHLEKYLNKAFALDPNQPVLIDKYVIGREIEVDAISDGEDVFMPGIMQHIEGTGIHSGDSISVYPAYSLSKKVEETIKDYTKRLGIAIGIKGLFNIQYIVDSNDFVYIIEVNPRSSRTIPYLSKSSKINLAKIATFVMLGDKLKDMNLVEPTPNMYYVKVPCFSFSKIRGLDTVLSPEMKSTGEAIGYDQSLNRALYKALKAANMRVINYGTVFVTLSDQTKEKALPLIRRFYNLGFNIEATKGTGKFLKEHGIKTRIKKKLSEGSEEILDSLRKGHVSYVINTVSHVRTNNDGFLIRRVAAENNITCFTSLDTVNALLDVLDEITIKVGTI